LLDVKGDPGLFEALFDSFQRVDMDVVGRLRSQDGDVSFFQQAKIVSVLLVEGVRFVRAFFINNEKARMSDRTPFRALILGGLYIKQISMSKSIALFGGSFNPPHRGHYEIVRRVARRKSIDEVWILPVFKHPFAKKMRPFSERLSACKRFFRPLGPKVKVKDLERRLGGMSWTLRLVKYLEKRCPNDRFSLILGSDAYRDRKKWKGFGEIQKAAGLIVFDRGPKSVIPNVSSTKIRSGS